MRTAFINERLKSAVIKFSLEVKTLLMKNQIERRIFISSLQCLFNAMIFLRRKIEQRRRRKKIHVCTKAASIVQKTARHIRTVFAIYNLLFKRRSNLL